MLERMERVLAGLRVYPERMWRNLHASGGIIFSQSVMLALVEKGLAREDAYRLVQGHALAAWERDRDFRASIESDLEVARWLTAEEIAACFQLQRHLRHVDHVFERVREVRADTPGTKPVVA
jgi:adenylosuccinate lyase